MTAYQQILIFLYNELSISTMKQSNRLPASRMQPSNFDKSTNGYPKSNISSLKAIMNQGRVPLSAYINDKPHKNQNKYCNLSYFDKLKAMLNKGQPATFRDKEAQANKMEVQSSSIPLHAESTQEYLDGVNPQKAVNKMTTQASKGIKIKERSQSMQGKSRPKNSSLIKPQGTIIKAMKQQPAQKQPTRKIFNKAYTQAQTLEPSKNPMIILPKFKAIKKENANYSKFAVINKEVSGIGVVQLSEILGTGANAVVRVGLCKLSGQQFAVKIYEKYKLIETSKKKRVFRQIEILSGLSHENIVSMHGCYQDKRQIHILFQFIPGAETLHEYLRANNLSEVSKNNIVIKVAEALSYLHSRGISHRDIKTDNVMIGQDQAIKLIDFGFATTVLKGQTHCGTPNYMAPELFCKKNIYNPFKVDIWALGILSYYLMEGCYPFRGYNEKELIRNITVGVFSYKKTEPQMQELINSMLHGNPQQRPQAIEVVKNLQNIYFQQQ